MMNDHLKRSDEHIAGKSLLVGEVELKFTFVDGVLKLGDNDITKLRKSALQSYEKIWMAECKTASEKHDARVLTL